MEVEGASKAVVCQWTPTQSSFMLSFLFNIVADGTRTSSGFKTVHLNSCAKALNDYFKLNRTGDQIEDNFIITLDHEHYTGHVAVSRQQLFLFNCCSISIFIYATTNNYFTLL